MSVEYLPVERREALGAGEFRRDFVGQRAVVLAGAIRRLPALESWSVDSLAQKAATAVVKVKRDSATHPTAVESMGFLRFHELLVEHETAIEAGQLDPTQVPPYLHDTLLMVEQPELLRDLEGFPLELLPRWYRAIWWRFALFFVGARGSLTPMHSDMADPHNLFFQVVGKKRFIVVAPEDYERCYRRGWRGSALDAEAPDHGKFPLFRDADVRECTLGPGDVLYIPPRAFHQVRGLERTISFAVDWHTRASALAGVAAVARGMPLSCVLYNAAQALGLWTGLPASVLYPLCAPHLRAVD